MIPAQLGLMTPRGTEGVKNHMNTRRPVEPRGLLWPVGVHYEVKKVRRTGNNSKSCPMSQRHGKD